MGDQTHQSSISRYAQGQWNEGFELLVSYHAQLFDTIQIDLYDAYAILPDKHMGRAEIRIKKLKGMPEEFTNYYEIWEKKVSMGASSVATQRMATGANVGALQAKIAYAYQYHEPTPMIKHGMSLEGSQHSHHHGEEERVIIEDFLDKLKKQREESHAICFQKYDDTTKDNASKEDPQGKTLKESPTSQHTPLMDYEQSSLQRDEESAQTREQQAQKEKDIAANNTLLGAVSSWFGFTSSVSSAESSLSTDPSHQQTSLEQPPTDKEKTTDLFNAINTLTEHDDSLKAYPILDTISSWTVNKETNQVLRAIGKLLVAYGQGFELSNLQIVTGFTMLEKFYHELSRDRTWDLVQDLSEIELASHFWDYSLVSYGWKGLNFIGKGNGYISDAVRDHSDTLTVIEYLKLPRECLLAYELRTGEAFRPSYFVVKDPKTNSIVLSIRGTMSAFDTMTDLVCEYEPWHGGFVHKGIKSSAMWFFSHVAPQLVAYANEHAVDALYIVGHSLGAATAAILTIMLLDFIDEFRKGKSKDLIIRCFGYAPACGLSLDLSERYKDTIQSIVFADDFVSKLSYGSMMDVKELVISGAEAAKHLGISQLLWAVEPENEQWKMAFDQMEECRRRCLESMDNPKLYVAGTVYQFWLDPVPGKDTRIVVERTDAYRVSKELIIQKSILLDHLPSNFDISFQRAREALKAQKDQPGKPNGILDSHSDDFTESTLPNTHPCSESRSDADAKDITAHLKEALAKEGLKRTTKISGGGGGGSRSGSVSSVHTQRFSGL
ncbi:hypothetical protein BDF14DRAFT_1798206 [Spinellus fusiger]|nr:hypothetical protein BDF14DRAFT_1798206 [Spinellus fusiger]